MSQRKPRKQTEKQPEEYGVKTEEWMDLQKRDARLTGHRAEDAISGGVSESLICWHGSARQHRTKRALMRSKTSWPDTGVTAPERSSCNLAWATLAHC